MSLDVIKYLFCRVDISNEVRLSLFHRSKNTKSSVANVETAKTFLLLLLSLFLAEVIKQMCDLWKQNKSPRVKINCFYAETIMIF